MSESDADTGKLPDRVRISESFTKEFVEKNEETLRRSENIQILIALGFLGLTGTLVAQDMISFPLLENASKSGLVRSGFRILVYSTIVFLTAKLVTSAFYPGTKNRILLILHERVEPFIYVFPSSSFGLLLVIVILIQNTPISLGDLVVVPIAVIPSFIFGFLYSLRRGEAYERLRDAEAEKIRVRLLWHLLIEEAWSSGMSESKLIDWSTFEESEEQVRAVLDDMVSDEDSLVKRQDGNVKLTDKYEAVKVLKRNGIPESELRGIVPDSPKSSPTANPDSDDETIFYCHECKKHWAENELNPLQVENRECPECGLTMDLHASPRGQRRK